MSYLDYAYCVQHKFRCPNEAHSKLFSNNRTCPICNRYLITVYTVKTNRRRKQTVIGCFDDGWKKVTNEKKSHKPRKTGKQFGRA